MNLDDLQKFASIAGTVVAVPGVLFAAYKTWQEVRQSREQRQAELEQRQQEHQLHRAEFTLAQHRRLFDDPDLRAVLRYLDGDQSPLASPEMTQQKRKFLTFIEELVLLRNSGLIDNNVALYMFGYYAFAAHRGPNFKVGIGYYPEHWGVFMAFAEEARKHLEKSVPGDELNLRL